MRTQTTASLYRQARYSPFMGFTCGYVRNVPVAAPKPSRAPVYALAALLTLFSLLPVCTLANCL